MRFKDSQEPLKNWEIMNTLRRMMSWDLKPSLIAMKNDVFKHRKLQQVR
jgi:hypothetical protein